MQVVRPQDDFLDRFAVVVDPDAEPFDLDRFLDALDRLVERRLAARKAADPQAQQQAEQQAG
jgi:hypothetical protein